MGFWEDTKRNLQRLGRIILIFNIILVSACVYWGVSAYYAKYKDYSNDVISAISKHDYAKAHKKLDKQLKTIQNRGGRGMDERIEELYEPYAVKLFTAELNYLMADDSRENVDRVIMLLGDFRTFGTPVVGVTDIKDVKKENERYMRSVARFNTLLDNVLARSIALHNQYLADNILPMYKSNLRKSLHDSHLFSEDEHSYEFTDEAKTNAEIIYQKAVKEKRFSNSISTTSNQTNKEKRFSNSTSTMSNQTNDDAVKKLLTDMYNNELYQNHEWLEAHCTDKCLQYLQREYEYICEDGPCYATWKFRTDNQDGDTDEHRMISVESKGNNYYEYTFIDMGFRGKNRVKIISIDNHLCIDEIIHISEETF